MRILFVDDEPIVLRATERMVRTRHPTWQTTSVTSGAAALAALAERPHDVIVSDIGMPGMDGVTLLTRVSEQFPDVLRFALSGDAGTEVRMRAVSVVHQWFAKPCILKDLMQRIEQVMEAGRLVDADARRALVRTACLPSPIVTHARLAEMRDASLDELGAVITTDAALCAKLLQLASSAFFGDGQATDSVAAALQQLGLARFWTLLEHGELATPSSRARPPVSDSTSVVDLLRDLVDGPDPVSRAHRTSFLLALWGLPDQLVRGVATAHDASSASLSA